MNLDDHRAHCALWLDRRFTVLLLSLHYFQIKIGYQAQECSRRVPPD